MQAPLDDSATQHQESGTNAGANDRGAGVRQCSRSGGIDGRQPSHAASVRAFDIYDYRFLFEQKRLGYSRRLLAGSPARQQGERHCNVPNLHVVYAGVALFLFVCPVCSHRVQEASST